MQRGKSEEFLPACSRWIWRNCAPAALSGKPPIVKAQRSVNDIVAATQHHPSSSLRASGQP
eukprot:7780756-Lingulodinium_polyedra.AAC.1